HRAAMSADGAARRPYQSSLMQKMSCRMLGEFYACFAKKSASSLPTPCFHGHPACARPTASGQNIGTTTSQDRHPSSHTSREKASFLIVCAKFMSNAANL